MIVKDGGFKDSATGKLTFTVAVNEKMNDQQRPVKTSRAITTFTDDARVSDDTLTVLAAIDAVTTDAFICIDDKNHIIHWNRAAEAMFGWQRSEAILQSLDIIIPEDMRDAHRRGLSRLVAGGDSKLAGRTVELSAVHRSGRLLPIELSIAAFSQPDQTQSYRFAAIVRDISSRKALEAESVKTRALLDVVIETMPAAIFVKSSHDNKFVMVNRAFEALTQQPRDAILGRSDYDFFPKDQADWFVERDREALLSGKITEVEEPITRPDGTTRFLRTKKLAIESDEHGQPKYLLGFADDITETREAQVTLKKLADHDVLTGLLNRAGFQDAVTTNWLGEVSAFLCLDLDRFKLINDLYGHAAGDVMLQMTAERLREMCPEHAHIARLGGDEFAIVVPGMNALAAARLADEVIAALCKPCLLEGVFAFPSTSVGIALAPSDGTSTVELLRSADMALYRAKTNGRGSYCFYEANMDQTARERRHIELDLRNAIARGEITLVYQPLVDIQTGQFKGFEALARWLHPTRGQIPPDLFIGVAEESGLIVTLGHHLLRMALFEAARWTKSLTIAVNISPIQIMHPGFVSDIEALLAETNLDASRLELEITEGLLIRDAEKALQLLRQLKRLGCSISMDDFGTGYSSLAYFRQFPFDKVKIDQSFIREMATNRQSLAVVQAVIGLGKGLEMPVVAEGVETIEQLETLRREGCELAQGFLVGTPMPIEEFHEQIFGKSLSKNDSTVAGSVAGRQRKHAAR